MPFVTHSSETNLTLQRDDYFSSGGGPYGPNHYTFIQVGSAANSKTGINNPSYREQIRRGQSATTVFSGYKTTVDVGKGGLTYIQPNGFGPGLYARWDGFGQITGINNPESVTKDSITAEQEALIRLYRRIKEQHQKFSGLVFLGELRQAIHMIKRPAESLFAGLNSYVKALEKRSKGVSKTSVAGKRRRKKILADTWLEYSFGWVPLISDVQDAAKALASWKVSRDGIDDRRYRISSSSQTLFPGTNTLELETPYSVYPGFTMRFDRRIVSFGKCNVTYKVGLSYKTSVPVGSAAHLAQLAGFSLSEFVPTAWELLPWSFLIDYFSSVGDVLSAFSTPLNNVSWIQKTVRFEDNMTVSHTLSSSWRSIPQSITIEQDGFSSYWSGKRTSFYREPLSGLDLPRLTLENPFGSNGLNRAVNMAALAAGARPLKPFY